jgi:hydroxymethylbilane synthase
LKKKEIFVGSRQSRLALAQTQWVVEQLKKRRPDLSFRVVEMKTRGDHILDVPLSKIGDKGLFTKELENALQKGECDLVVHSMKDLPTQLPEGLIIGAICAREYPGDVLIAKNGTSLSELPAGAVLGTSSLRRKAQLLRFRQDLKICDLRGNLTTRLRKLNEQDLDGIIVAYAGVCRLRLEQKITQKIPFSICLPAVGQGSLGLEIRAGDAETELLVKDLDDSEARLAVTAERAFLRRLEGGCQVPIGALGRVEGETLVLEGIVLSFDGSRYVRESIGGSKNEASGLGVALAEKMLSRGAQEILAGARETSSTGVGE